MNLISLLITVIIVGLIFGLIWWIVHQLPLPAPFKMVVEVLVGLIAVVFLLSLLFGGINLPVFRLN
jgi:F0F1-type ATP synthase assembly protein I